MNESKEESLGEYSRKDRNSAFESSSFIKTQSSPQRNISAVRNADREMYPEASTGLSNTPGVASYRLVLVLWG